MSIVNSNNFLHKTVDGVKQFFSPLVHAATVVLKDGTRLEKDGKIHADTADQAKNAEDSAKLGGVAASDYAKKTDIPTDTGGLQMDLVWPNPSPGSAFEVQTIELDLSGYDAVMLICTQTTTYTKNRTPLFMRIGESGLIQGYDHSTEVVRVFSVSETGIAVENVSAGNKYFIPTSVYGIKGVKNLDA